jgi:hypothetical protein
MKTLDSSRLSCCMRNDSVISRNRAVIKRGNLLEDERKCSSQEKMNFHVRYLL